MCSSVGGGPIQCLVVGKGAAVEYGMPGSHAKQVQSRLSGR